MNKIILFLLIGSCWISVAFAAELVVAESAITTAIENQQPVDQVGSYPADFGKLFCYTRILGATTETSITHVWYFRDHVMAEVVLPVVSENWRTYSSKRFLPQWAGQWRVKVIDTDGNELADIPFLLE
ncbi:MAG TPA: DUF2914 domain-containing protein [Malonomonas sp.]